MDSLVLHAFFGIREPFSSLTHLLGALVFCVLAYALVRPTIGGRLHHTASLGLFALASVLLLAMSGIYHLLPPDTTARTVLHRLDHVAIFFLIAASFTPTHCLLFKGAWRWGMLLLVWIIAIFGITPKAIFFTSIPEWLSLSMYIGFGSLGFVSGISLGKRYGFKFIRPLFWGGMMYAVGALLEYFREPLIIPGVIGPHELFHIAVLTALGLHWYFTYTATCKRYRYRFGELTLQPLPA